MDVEVEVHVGVQVELQMDEEKAEEEEEEEKEEPGPRALPALAAQRRPCGVVLRRFLPHREVEELAAGVTRVEGRGEQALVVLRTDEPATKITCFIQPGSPGVAVFLEEEEVDVVGGLVVGVPRGGLHRRHRLRHRLPVYVDFCCGAFGQELTAKRG